MLVQKILHLCYLYCISKFATSYNNIYQASIC